jgi:hypothetical protein
MAGAMSDPETVGVISLVRPELRALLRQYRIPANHLVELLERALAAAVDSWHPRTDKGLWLLMVVASECSAYCRDHNLPAPTSCNGPGTPG